MPRKLIEKLTGSFKLSPEELKDLNKPINTPGPIGKGAITPPPPSSIFPRGSSLSDPARSLPNAAPTGDESEVIEEVDEDELDFELPPDDEIETVEEVIEDDNIDAEVIEEYYEVIDEEEVEDESDELTAAADNDYPVFDFHGETEDEELAEQKRARTLSHAEVEEKREDPRVHLAGVHELQVDIYELHHELIIRTLIPGITPENLKVSITRDHVTLSGDRPSPDSIAEGAYYTREIPFGTFSRTIILPVEVDVERAEAVEKYGLLIIRLPKIDIRKSQELKVRSA